MSTEQSKNTAILKFATPSSGQNSFLKQISIEWDRKKKESTLMRLCVALCTLHTGELVLLMITLESTTLETLVDLPLQLDTEPGPVRITIYGLAKPDDMERACYVIALSVAKILDRSLTEKVNGICNIELSSKHTKGMSFTDLHEKATEFKLGIKQQPPSLYYVSGLPVTDTPQKARSQGTPQKAKLQKAKPSQYCIVLQQHDPFEEVLVLMSTSQSTVLIPRQLPSQTDFTVKVLQLRGVLLTDTFVLYTVVMASNRPTFRTYLSSTELDLLYTRATQLLTNRAYHSIEYFYRNKPPQYYKKILTQRSGVMEKYRKDYNGDQASSINGNIDGLFFGTGLNSKTKQPPDFSYYGSQRLHIPATIVFHNGTKLYFADFYCHYEVHYVTLVLTEEGSTTDAFCRERLRPLDPFANPFLYKHDATSRSPMYVTKNLHVEVFYTENVNIQQLMSMYPGYVFFTSVTTKGVGKTKPMGIPKNAHCKICNLKPNCH